MRQKQHHLRPRPSKRPLVSTRPCRRPSNPPGPTRSGQCTTNIPEESPSSQDDSISPAQPAPTMKPVDQVTCSLDEHSHEAQPVDESPSNPQHPHVHRPVLSSFPKSKVWPNTPLNPARPIDHLMIAKTDFETRSAAPPKLPFYIPL